MERLSRRDFVKLGAGAALAGAIGIRELASPQEVDPFSGELTFDRALALADHFDHLNDQIPDSLRGGITNLTQMNNWIKEIVPFFGYENITDPEADTGELGGSVYPEYTFEYYEDPQGHNHILGTTNIFNHDIALNARMSNPESPWFGREDSVMTLIHELGHAQGITTDGERIDTEASTQLVTLEVASAMVNRGNTKLLAGLTDELRWMSLSAASYIALTEGKREGFLQARDRLFPSALDQADMDKRDRYWEQDPEKLKQILYSYNFVPIQEVLNGMQRGNVIDGVKLPINWLADLANTPNYMPAYYGPTATPTPGPEPTPWPTQGLHIDDLAYFMHHGKEMVKAL